MHVYVFYMSLLLIRHASCSAPCSATACRLRRITISTSDGRRARAGSDGTGRSLGDRTPRIGATCHGTPRVPVPEAKRYKRQHRDLLCRGRSACHGPRSRFRSERLKQFFRSSTLRTRVTTTSACLRRHLRRRRRPVHSRPSLSPSTSISTSMLAKRLRRRNMPRIRKRSWDRSWSSQHVSPASAGSGRSSRGPTVAIGGVPSPSTSLSQALSPLSAISACGSSTKARMADDIGVTFKPKNSSSPTLGLSFITDPRRCFNLLRLHTFHATMQTPFPQSYDELMYSILRASIHTSCSTVTSLEAPALKRQEYR